MSVTDGPKLPRWTPQYIEDELQPLAGRIKRVWVVGPPVVNEMFDKTLALIGHKIQLDKDAVEIM